MLDARDFRKFRPAAGGDQDRTGGIALARDLHRVRVDQLAASVDQLHPGILQQPQIDAVQPVDLGVLALDQARPVMRRLAHIPAEAGGILEIAMEMRGIDQQLLRHAAADDAGAADPVILADRHPRPMPGGNPAGAHAARPGANDEEVVVVVGLAVLGHDLPFRLPPAAVPVFTRYRQRLARWPGKIEGVCHAPSSCAAYSTALWAAFTADAPAILPNTAPDVRPVPPG